MSRVGDCHPRSSIFVWLNPLSWLLKNSYMSRPFLIIQDREPSSDAQMTPKIEEFLRTENPETPCLVVDLDVIAACYKRLQTAIPGSQIYYAVKANPASPVLQTLADLGSKFDAASPAEIDRCLAVGAAPEDISYGNTIKKKGDIATAYGRGIRLFAFDSEEELEKLAMAAPGAQVFCRVQVPNAGAAWPLSNKFGCSVEMATELLLKAGELGLEPFGVSFHVGSQQTSSDQWDVALARVAMVFTDLREKGIYLKSVNLGGGYPTQYRDEIQEIEAFAQSISRSLNKHFGNQMPEVMLEPGRYIAADAGLLRSEVVLVSRKSQDASERWVYLDVGKFGGLMETTDEAIQYKVKATKIAGDTGPCILAGPTCDGADVLYPTARYELPLSLKSGDQLDLLSAGAYTTSYASVGFNGFPPLKEYYL